MHKSLLSSLVVLGSFAALSMAATNANAQQAVSLVAGAGPAEVLHSPYAHPDYVFTRNQFRTGVEGNAALLFSATPWLSLGPAASVSYFTPNSNENAEASVLWNFDGEVSLHGSHANNVSPFVSISGGIDKHGSTFNPSMAAAAGIDLSVEPTHTYWVGVYGGWDHVFQTHSDAANNSEIMAGHDVNTATLGARLTFDFPVKQVHTTTTVVNTVEVVKTVPGPVRVITVQAPADQTAPEWSKATARLTFQKDSTELSDDAKKDLDGVAAVLKEHTNATLQLEGHASVEGQVDYNWLLARSRSEAVLNYLVSQGVDRARLVPASFGPTGDATDDGMKNNRAVEFMVHIVQQ